MIKKLSYYKKRVKKPKTWSSKIADTKFSKWIMERDDYKCQKCGHGQERHLTCSHFWGRTRSSTRYHPDNCLTLCWMPCHVKWEKEKQGEYEDFMRKRLGERGYNELKDRANISMKRVDAIREFQNIINQVYGY